MKAKFKIKRVFIINILKVFIVLLILFMDLIFFNKKILNFHFIFNVPKPLICSIDTQVKEICINIPLPSELSIK